MTIESSCGSFVWKVFLSVISMELYLSHASIMSDQYSELHNWMHFIHELMQHIHYQVSWMFDECFRCSSKRIYAEANILSSCIQSITTRICVSCVCIIPNGLLVGSSSFTENRTFSLLTIPIISCSCYDRKR